MNFKELFLICYFDIGSSSKEFFFCKKLSEEFPKHKVKIEPIQYIKCPIDSVYTLIVIIPLLGDNDLIPELESQLCNYLALGDFKEYKIFIIFKGDRHQSDEYISKKSPAYLKTKSIFYKYPQIVIIDNKLDEFTNDKVVCSLSEYFRKTSRNTISILNQMYQLIGSPFEFDACKNLLNFYQSTTGNSLVKELCNNDFKKVFQLINILKPEILNLSYAYISENKSQYMKMIGSVTTLEANSNNLTLHNIIQFFPNLKRLNLAANNLSSGIECINNLKQLTDLQLYKNRLNYFELEGDLLAQIRRISLYRNKLKDINFTGDCSQIEYLNIGANPISTIPSKLSESNKLTFLGLARTKVKDLPDWIFYLPSLETVDLSYIEDQIPTKQIMKLCKSNMKIITRPGYSYEKFF